MIDDTRIKMKGHIFVHRTDIDYVVIKHDFEGRRFAIYFKRGVYRDTFTLPEVKR